MSAVGVCLLRCSHGYIDDNVDGFLLPISEHVYEKMMKLIVDESHADNTD